jgi:hypothetical protein
MPRRTKMGALLIIRAVIRAVKPICARFLPMIAGVLKPAKYYLAGTLGLVNMLCNLQGFYRAYSEIKLHQQRKARMTNHVIGFSLNMVYTIAAFSQEIIPYHQLTYINIANNTLSLVCFSYILHQNKQAFKNLEEAVKNASENNLLESEILEKTIKLQCFSYFKNKADVAYSSGLIFSNSIFISSYFFSPLVFAGMGTMSVQTIIELYDRNTDLKFSLWLTNNLSLIDDNVGSTRSIQEKLGFGDEQVISCVANEAAIITDYHVLPDVPITQSPIRHFSPKNFSKLFSFTPPANDPTQIDCALSIPSSSGTP